VANKRVQTEMWAFDLPLWAYVLVGFCPMGFCPMGFCPTLGYCCPPPSKNCSPPQKSCDWVRACI